MKPTKYTKNGNKITYHYTFSELRKFLEHGFKEGNNGVIIVGQDDKWLYYKGFGTIENPWTYVASISMENDPMFDGEMPNPEEVINQPKRNSVFEPTSNESYSFHIWDATQQ